MKLSIIIPAYNEEKTISQIIKSVVSLEFPSVKKEIIVIDDGSTDSTSSKISAFEKSDIRIIRHKKNQGKGTSIQTGIAHATGDYIVIQDADLEYNPVDIVTLINLVIEGKSDVVYGTRLKRMPHFSKEERELRFILHYFGNKLLSFITSVLYGQWLTDMETCYKLFPKKAVTQMKLRARRFDFEPEITAKLLKSGYHILEIPIKTTPRSYNQGKKLRTFHDGSIAIWTLLKYRFVD